MALSFVVVAYVLPATVLGVVASGLTSSVVLRQHWGIKVAALDTICASVVMVLSMFVLGVIYANRTTDSFPDSRGVGLTISTASVLARHLILLTLRSSGP
jgi:branched-subunit amino acid transport protein AzlD